MPEFAFWLSVILLVVTLVGHGIWVFLAFLFRTLAGSGDRAGKSRARQQKPCPLCGHLTPVDLSRCDVCGRELESPLAKEAADLDALKRQLARFREKGVLEPEVAAKLLQRVQGYRKELLAPPLPPLAASQPAPEEPVVLEVVAEQKPPEKPGPVAKPRAAVVSAKPRAPVVAAKPRPTPPRPPRKPLRRRFAELLADREIHWTEAIGVLVGGLLMVCSSVMLVVSLWSALERTPPLQFFVFIGYSAVVFAAGLYAYHRWKLPSTGRGLLVIATLLVPLDFLAVASLRREGWDPLTLAAELISLGICTWLVWLAARVLVPAGTRLAALAVVGNSALLLLLPRLIGGEPSGAAVVLGGCLPVALFAAAVLGYLATAAGKKEDLGAAGANGLFALLGLAAFAAAAAVVPVVVPGAKSLGAAVVTDLLAVPLALGAVPILAAGLRVMRGTGAEKSLAGHRTAGTAVALLGMAASIAALCLAWPMPAGVMTVGLLSAAGLAWAAWQHRFPAFHAGAIACLGLAYVVGVHWCFEETLRSPPSRNALGLELLEQAISGRTGTALAGLVAVLAAASELFARAGRRNDGRVYAGGAGVAVALGLVLVTVHGFLGGGADALRAAALYAVYGTLSLLLTARWRRVELNYLGIGLLAAAPFWALWWRAAEVSPAWPALLAAEALLLGLVATALEKWGRPTLRVAEVIAPLAIGLTGWLAIRPEIAGVAPMVHTPWPLATAACLTAFYLLAAWMKQSPGRTWAASIVLLAGLVHTTAINYPELVTQRWLVPLLAHATAAIAAAIGLDGWFRRRGDEGLSHRVDQVFGKPASDGGVLSSLLALVVLPFVPWSSTATMAACLAWLAIVWLAIAWRERNPALFAAHQAMLTLAVVLGATAWLEGQPWVARLPLDLFHPYSLQTLGVALGLLSLAWLAVRIVFRRSAAARRLLDPGWPAVDFCVRHAVVWGQLILAGWWLLPGIAMELLPMPVVRLAAFGPGAWLLWSVVAAMLVVSLWQRWATAERLAAVSLLAALSFLVAGQFFPDKAVASALRWSSAGAFLLGSIAVWQRRRPKVGESLRDSSPRHVGESLRDSSPVSERPGYMHSSPASERPGYMHSSPVSERPGYMHSSPASERPRYMHSSPVSERPGYVGSLARAALIGLTAVPVLAVTLLAAGLQLGGVSPRGPVAESFFGRIGPAASYLVPLALVMLTLVGHALRERSAGYAFSAGLVAELAVLLGYALRVTTTGDKRFDVGELVMLVQLGTIAAAAWAAAWLAVRRRLDIWRKEPQPGSSGALMNVQLGMGAAGMALLLLSTLAIALVMNPTDRFSAAWTSAVGSAWGWVALAGVAGAWAFRRIQRRQSLRPAVVGLVGMAVLELLASTVGAQAGGWWGYRTLMLSWAAYAWFIVTATWWAASARTLPDGHGPPQALVRAAAVWVRAAGILAVLLGLRAAVFRDADVELLWSAAAISIASLAGATMAVWRRREGWALAAALGVNVAASLVVWYARVQQPFADWWLRLVQANVIASAAVALAWLAARRRLYLLRELDLRHSPLLAVQTALPVLGNLVLLAAPLPPLFVAAAFLPGSMARLAEWPGWLGLVLTAAAGAWYLRQALPRDMMHAVAGLGLGAGVLLACGAATVNGPGGGMPWLELHVLLTAWAAAALVVLGVGMAGRRLRLFPAATTRGWATLIGGAVVYLVVAKTADTTVGFWWSARALLAVSAAFALIALWLRRPGYVFASGLLLNVIGVIAWMGMAGHDFSGLLSANAACLAAGAVAWTLLDLFLPGKVPHPVAAGRKAPFAHLAARAAVGLMAAVVGLALAGELIGGRAYTATRLDWIALGATALAAAVLLWDRASRFSLAGLYATGLLAVVLFRLGEDLAPRALGWATGVDLAAVALAAALMGRVLPQLASAWRAVRIPQTTEDGRSRWPVGWFHAGQALVMTAAAVLAAWIALDARFSGFGAEGAFALLAGRNVAAVAAAMLLLAAAVMSRCVSTGSFAGHGPMLRDDGRRRAWQVAALGGGVLLVATAGWALLDATSAVYWLHVEVVLLVAAAVVTLAAGIGLPKLLSAGSDWIEAGRRAAPVLGGLTGIALLAVLVHEIGLFVATGEVPLAGPAIGVVAAALAALAIGCLTFALNAEWDPLGLSDRGRQVYVYAAEVLAALVGLHLYLTMPWLFQRGLVRRYWMLVVMGVAFVGAGLSELFRRRGLSVLSVPLERTALALPLVPAIGFWLIAETAGQPLALAGPSPAMWLLMGLFYGMMAQMRRSLGCGVASIVSGTIGVWVLWARLDIDIARHPQLWLIPPALAALVAEYLNRDRLTASGSAAFRYLALGVIYVASTADMFIAGIGEDWRLPLVLMLFSVAGILAGFLLRVQSFLLLGFVFLVVDLASMIGYAAFGLRQMWVLWACCIVVGAGIIALFGVLERRRQVVLGAYDKFRQWER